MDWNLIIAAGAGGLLVKVFDYLTTGRVDKMTKIQNVYEKSMDDMTERHEKETLRQEKKILDLERERDLLSARLEESRQKQGEMLVTIEDMRKTVNNVDNNVNQITGDFGKFPLSGDRATSEPYGRRALDKPSSGT